MFHMSALPKPSGLCVDSMSCSSEMIFIPLGILDKFAWSPLTKHVLGRVSPNLSWDCSFFYQNNYETADFGLILEACVTAVTFSIHASRMPFGTALWSRCCWESQQKSEQLGLFSSLSPTSSLFCLSFVFFVLSLHSLSVIRDGLRTPVACLVWWLGKLSQLGGGQRVEVRLSVITHPAWILDSPVLPGCTRICVSP